MKQPEAASVARNLRQFLFKLLQTGMLNATRPSSPSGPTGFDFSAPVPQETQLTPCRPASYAPRLMRQVHAEAPPTAREPESSRGFFGRWWPAVLAPAGVVLAIATIVLWSESRRLDQQLAALRASAQQQQQQLREAREAADFVAARDTITVALAPQPDMPKGAAHVMYNAKMGMLMYDGEIAPAPAAKSYQLWLFPLQGKPVSAGVFNPVSGRPNHWMMKLPEGIAPKAFAVALEPAGGMPQPTGPMVLMGSVSRGMDEK